MRRTITLLALALSLTALTGCKDKKNNDTEVATSTADSKKELFAIADQFHDAFKKKNAEAIKQLTTTDGGIFLGTDPAEVMNQQSFINYLNQKLTNPAIGTIEYKIDRRELIIAEDGQGAILTDQFTPIVFTQNIAWRMSAHLIKKNNAWKFDYISLALTPNNNILPAVNMAAYQEK